MITGLMQFGGYGLLFLRFVVASIFWIHGTSKFGMWKASPSEQMPAKMIAIMRFLSIAESLGALAMFFGLLTQLTAIGFSIIMIGAIYFKMFKWKSGFTSQQTTGWELDLLILTASIAILTLGPGAWALDNLIFLKV